MEAIPTLEIIIKMNRIQFQPGMSVSELHRSYGTKAQCVAVLTQVRWSAGFVCPQCGLTHAASFRLNGKPGWQCASCNRQTTLTSGTLFHSTKLSLTTWFQAMYFLTQTKTNLSALEMARLLGVSYSTAWRIKHKLMQVMIEREVQLQASFSHGTIHGIKYKSHKSFFTNQHGYILVDNRVGMTWQHLALTGNLWQCLAT